MIVVLDAETVPEGGPIGPGLVDYARQVAGDRLEETEHRDSFLKPHQHRVVAVAATVLDREAVTVQRITLATELGATLTPDEADAGERLILTWLDLLLRPRPVIVGWCTRRFDLPVFGYRAMRHGTALPALYAGDRQYDRYDYRYGERHIDLADLLSWYGSSSTLRFEEAQALCGLRPKPLGSGGDVNAMVESGRWAELGAYVTHDTTSLAAMFLRYRAITGRYTFKHVRRGIELLRDALPVAPLDGGLREDLDRWLVTWLA